VQFRAELLGLLLDLGKLGGLYEEGVC
jgi:hypothetical protein